MRTKTQTGVMNALEPQALRAVDRIRHAGLKEIVSMWNDAKNAMKLAILHEYRRDFGKDKWSLGLARSKGTLLRIEKHVAQILLQFQADSMHAAGQTFKQVYHEGVMRHAWILDQVTPESYDVKIPVGRQMREADVIREAGVAVYTGSDSDQAWRERWSNWMGAYQSALNSNIRLGAINESEAEEAAGEVDDTKAGTPAYDPEDALTRVFQYQALSSYSEALDDLTESNLDMGVVEIWQTRYNARVCDDCDANAGLEADEADGEIPLHPNCECYYRLVPKSFADLLRSGDADENDLAELLDAHNVVPDGLVIRDNNGKPVAKSIVSFERWSADMPRVVGANR